MKKIIAILIALVLTLSLCACQKNDGSNTNSEASTPTVSEGTDSTEDTTKDENKIDDENSMEDSNEEPKQESGETPEKETEDNSKVEADNYFINNNNNIITANELTIRPKHVYWENGKLVAKCFIINGTPKTVNAVKVDSIEFSNTEGRIAIAGFGILENAPKISSNGHIEWTFVFGADCIENSGANLKTLHINFDLEYLY